MVALVKGDSFCVKSDRLLEVARLARGVALSHLRQHHGNLVRHVFFLFKTILAIIVINTIRKDLLNMGWAIFNFKYIDHVVVKTKCSPFQERAPCWPRRWPTQRPCRLAPAINNQQLDIFNCFSLRDLVQCVWSSDDTKRIGGVGEPWVSSDGIQSPQMGHKPLGYDTKPDLSKV